MKKVLYILIALFLLFSGNLLAQPSECECTNCPLFLPDGDRDTLFLNVAGVINDNLASPSQGVCGIRLVFDHQYLGDLDITLISPSGQEIQLIGPAGFHGFTDFSTWDVTFVPCSETPNNPYTDRFDSEILSVGNTDFTGTFWPAGNPSTGGAALDCLENYDTGPVNGTWKIYIEDNLAIDAGTFLDFELILCDPTGLSDCALNPCGVFLDLEGPSFLCEDFEDDLILDASGSNGETFIWDAADGGSFDVTPSGSIVNILTAGTYFLTVTNPDDAAGSCIETTTFVVPPFYPVPEIGITQSGALSCGNPEITLESTSNLPGSTGVEVWVKDGDIDNGVVSEDIIVTEPGDYELTVIDLLTGCETSETITIADESTYPTAEAATDGMISCANTSVLISGDSDTNGVDYNWDGPNGFISGDQSFEISEPGIYNLTVTNSDNGCSEISFIEILTDTISPSFTVSAGGDLDCTNTETSLGISTNDTFDSFEWTGPNNYSNSTDDSPLIEIGGTYTLIATNANGCTSESSVEVMQSADVPTINTVDDGVISCDVQDFALSGSTTSPGATYSWTGPNNFTSTDAAPGMVTDTGTYILTVLATNGCSVSSQVFVDADTIQPSLTIDEPSILGCSNTTTTLSVSTLETGLTYAWTGPNNQNFDIENPDIEGPGIYNLTITGQNGCQNTFSVEVASDDTEPTVDVSILQTDIITCDNQDALVINGNDDATYTYAWTGPNGFTSESSNPSLEAEGTYNVVVTGANGCTASSSVKAVENITPPDINFTTAEITCAVEMVSIGVSSTVNIVEYAWTGVNGYTSIEQNPSDITASGEYTATITGENGCTNTVTFEVTQSQDTPEGQIEFPQGITLDCNLTSLMLTGSSSTNGATLEWEDPMGNMSSGVSISADEIGIYTLIVTGPNGCDQPITIEIDQDLDGPEITANPNVDLECEGDVPLTVQSSDNIVSYSWTGPGTFASSSTNPSVGVDGIYTVELTGDNGCTSTTTVEVINQQIPPNIFVDPTQTLVCGQDQLSIGGGSNDNNVSYSWTTNGGNIVSSINQATIDINAQGTYILTVTNNTTGCEDSAEILVNQDNDTPIADIVSLENSITCNTGAIILDALGSDNGNDFEFVWGNDGGTSLNGESSLQPTVTEAGTYFITVTNTTNQCTSIASIEIESDLEQPNIELSNFDAITCTNTSISVENIAANGSSNLEYDWQVIQGGNISSAADLSEIDIDLGGTYTLNLINTDNGCSNSLTFEVDQNIIEPIISAGTNLTLDCGIDALALDGSISSGESNISILWTSDSGTILSGEDTFQPEVGSAATYMLTVTNNENGCIQTSEVIVEPNQDLPIIEFEMVNDFNCATNSIVLDASSSTNGMGITYQWTSEDGSNIFVDDTANPEIFEPGTYSLTILNTANNCETSNDITIGADTIAPTLVLELASELSCTVDEVTLAASSDLSGLDLQWSALTGNIVSGETSATPLVNQAGEYELTVTSQENQCTTSATVMVDLDENTPSVSISVPEELTCNREELTLDATNSTQGTGISLNWTIEGGNIVEGESGLTPTINMPGIYTLTISNDDNGCSVSQTVEVTENKDTPELEINMPDVLDCNNPTIDIQALNLGASVYDYEWETLDGNIVGGVNTLNPSIDEDGRYVLTATDTQNGCSTIIDVTVDKDIEQPEIVIGNLFELTCSEPTALEEGIGSSTGNDFSYTWLDESNIEISTDLEQVFSAEGTYTLVITDNSNGCTNENSLQVIDLQQLPDVEIADPETINCYTPIIQIQSTDLNNQNLEYTWQDEMGNLLNSNSENTSINVDQAGTYSLIVVDPTNGCKANYSVSVDANQTTPEVTVVSANNGELDCEDPIITLTGNLNGLNIDDVLINWTTDVGNFIDGQNTLNPTVGAAGTYQLEITDLNNGCTNMDDVSVTQDDAIPLATLNEPQDLNCEITSTTLSIPFNAGNVQIDWTLDGNPLPNTNSNEITIDMPGEYIVSITNLDNGCNSMDIVNVDQDIDSPIIDAGDDFELQCNIPDFTIQALIDGNANYEIQWDAGNGNISQGFNSLNPVVDEPGLYTLQVLNSDNGCISTDEVNITLNSNIPTDLIADPLNPQCADDLGAINFIDVVGGEGPYSFSIDGGNTYNNAMQYMELASGTYQLAALDANDCPITQEVTIDAPLNIGVDLQEEIEIIVGDSATLIANLSNIDPNDIQSIQWSPSVGLSCDDCLTPTTTTPIDVLYTLEIILDSGCSTLDQIQLRVDRDLNIFIPNAFSPFNLDGANDEFYLFAKDNVVTNINTFAIYDRWGTQVFLRENIQANDASQAWNGEFKNEKMQPDVYIYYIDLEFRDGSREILKGDVTLMN